MVPRRQIRPQDALKLAILGSLLRAPAPSSEIVSAVQCIGGHNWQPAAEAIISRLIELTEEGLAERIDKAARFPRIWFAITERGREEVQELLRTRIVGPCVAIDRAWLSMKVCLLDLLDQGERAGQLDALVETHQSERLRLRRTLAHCPEEWGYVRRWVESDLERVDAELARLEQLRGCPLPETASALERRPAPGRLH